MYDILLGYGGDVISRLSLLQNSGGSGFLLIRRVKKDMASSM